MSTENISIAKAELEIMRVIWKAGEPITSTEIGNIVENKGWKRTTIATFLARLVEKGMLNTERRGRSLYYTAKVSFKEYKKGQARNLIQNVFGGSARDLIVSLAEEDTFSEEEIAELRDYFNDRRK